MKKLLLNMKIGKKMALLSISGAATIACLGGLSYWALGAVHSGVDQEQIESGKMMDAQRIGSDLGVVAIRNEKSRYAEVMTYCYAFDTINHFFLISEMIVPGSSTGTSAWGWIRAMS